MCRMAPEVIACDENPDSTYDCKVSSDNTECKYSVDSGRLCGFYISPSIAHNHFQVFNLSI